MLDSPFASLWTLTEEVVKAQKASALLIGPLLTMAMNSLQKNISKKVDLNLKYLSFPFLSYSSSFPRFPLSFPSIRLYGPNIIFLFIILCIYVSFCRDLEIKKAAQECRVPTLIFHGKDDTFILPHHSQDLCALFSLFIFLIF